VSLNARYVHTNLVARDWKQLTQFYQDVFGCVPVPPERDYSGEEFDRLTNLTGAHQRGMHLRLPGFGDDGPTLEIFEYEPALEKPGTMVNRQGFGHIAFVVDDVQLALRAVLEAGGGQVGELVRLTRADGKRVTLVYATDPEGNVIELQRWS
jgi:catechol 2,3-dioxygenase-like lactoylglutathione lyase family enzyme